MNKGIFVTATGTDVGKTYVSGLLLKALRKEGISAGYYKAALSGAEWENGELVPGDAEHVARTAGMKRDADAVSYIYEHAVSPHLAAKLEGNPVELTKVRQDYQKMQERYDYVLTEGSGGIVCPIRYDDEVILLEDIIKALELDVVIVASAALGTINHVVLTVEYIRSRGIGIRGIILNEYHKGDVMEEDNRYMVEQLTHLPVLACVATGDTDIDIDLNAIR